MVAIGLTCSRMCCSSVIRASTVAVAVEVSLGGRSRGVAMFHGAVRPAVASAVAEGRLVISWMGRPRCYSPCVQTPMQVHRAGHRCMWSSFSPLRWIRNSAMLKRRNALAKAKPSAAPVERTLELDVDVSLQEGLTPDADILNIAEMLRLNAPMAMKVALHGLKDSKCKTRNRSIDDVGSFEKAELSILFCNDDFIRRLNNDLRKEDHSTDVLSIPQHVPGYQLPILMLGDIVISVDTAARQAEERGHNLLDEVRILMVHGLLHLLGYDHEKGREAELEMEREEETILKLLQWKGKGLIHSSNIHNASKDSLAHSDQDNMKKKILRANEPKFKYLFCDMDGTLLNSQSQVTQKTADALKEAIDRGVRVIISTGKTRPAVMSAFELVGLVGNNGVVSRSSPGVFLQGLLVYGKEGIELYRRDLDASICKKAFQFSLEQHVPLVGFSEDRTVTLFNHPLIEELHSVYLEPKAEVMPSVDDMLASASIQKLLFIDSAESVHDKWRPYWSSAIKGRARVVQALPEMLEILPAGASKGVGAKMLLDHLGANVDQVMAIGDGENDVEMLELVRLGVVMDNGAEAAKNVADVIVASNDEDGAADAVYRYLL